MRFMYRVCACGWLLSLVTVRGNEARNLPVEAREHLEKQAVALRNVYFEVEHTRTRENREKTYTFTAYFERDRFRIKAPSDVAFDGEMLWLVSTRPENERPAAILRKTKIRNTSETTPSFNEHYWRFPYFEAAGIYCPPYPKDLRNFKSLESSVLHFVENNDSMEIIAEGANLRVRFIADDWVLLNLREIDPELYRKQIEGIPVSAKEKTNSIKGLLRAQSMVPKRTISMLLDSEHGYLPLEREDRTQQGQLIARYNVEEWKYLQDQEIWLPAKCIVTYFTNPLSLDEFSAEPTERIKLNLKAAKFSTIVTEFALINDPKYRVAGNEVHDETIKRIADGLRHPIILTIAADGRLLENSVPAVNPAIGKRKVSILIMLFALGVAPIFFFIQRLISKKH